MGMDQYLLIPFLGGWTSKIPAILMWTEGVQGFDTLPNLVKQWWWFNNNTDDGSFHKFSTRRIDAIQCPLCLPWICKHWGGNRKKTPPDFYAWPDRGPHSSQVCLVQVDHYLPLTCVLFQVTILQWTSLNIKKTDGLFFLLYYYPWLWLGINTVLIWKPLSLGIYLPWMPTMRNWGVRTGLTWVSRHWSKFLSTKTEVAPTYCRFIATLGGSIRHFASMLTQFTSPNVPGVFGATLKNRGFYGFLFCGGFFWFIRIMGCCCLIATTIKIPKQRGWVNSRLKTNFTNIWYGCIHIYNIFHTCI